MLLLLLVLLILLIFVDNVVYNLVGVVDIAVGVDTLNAINVVDFC